MYEVLKYLYPVNLRFTTRVTFILFSFLLIIFIPLFLKAQDNTVVDNVIEYINEHLKKNPITSLPVVSKGMHYSGQIEVYYLIGLTKDQELFVKRMNLATDEILSSAMADIEDLSSRIVEQNSGNSTIQILCKNREKCVRTHNGNYDKSLTLSIQANSRVADKVGNAVRELIEEAQVY